MLCVCRPMSFHDFIKELLRETSSHMTIDIEYCLKLTQGGWGCLDVVRIHLR